MILMQTVQGFPFISTGRCGTEVKSMDSWTKHQVLNSVSANPISSKFLNLCSHFLISKTGKVNNERIAQIVYKD
jgi:hypothetical protein